MFFYLLERAKEYIDNKYNLQAIATLAYLILYSYVPKDLIFYFWTLFVTDVTITYYKKIVFDKIDEWYEEKNIEKEVKVVRSPISARSKSRQEEDIKTNKSGYFESALDEEESISESAFRKRRKETDNSSSTSTDLMIDKMIKDSKSF